jgi:hypothetical protein
MDALRLIAVVNAVVCSPHVSDAQAARNLLGMR